MVVMRRMAVEMWLRRLRLGSHQMRIRGLAALVLLVRRLRRTVPSGRRRHVMLLVTVVGHRGRVAADVAVVLDLAAGGVFCRPADAL